MHTTKQKMKEHKKRHFLVVAAASRGARFFVKKALRQGHDVTALCRAVDDKAALRRMNDVLENTNLTPDGIATNNKTGKLKAKNSNILKPETYAQLLKEDKSIDAICCFVGVTKTKDMINSKNTLYTDTIQAIVDGQRNSRWVETLYHGSVGTEGVPGKSLTAWPANYNMLSNLVQVIFPIFKNVTKSEAILAKAQPEGLDFIIFRPAALKDTPAKRRYAYVFNTTGLNSEELPLKYAKRTIGREDTAEEILRVATLSNDEKKQWYGQGVYLVDMKDNYFKKFKK